jgi:putative lipoprotein
MRWPWFAVPLVLGAQRAHADDWFARDKALHFGASAAIASVGYGCTTALVEDRTWAVGVGAGLAVAAGAAKEGWDATGRGAPSWKDFTWDVVGTGFGLAVGWGLDALLRRPRARARASEVVVPTRLATFDLRLSTFDHYGVSAGVAHATFTF